MNTAGFVSQALASVRSSVAFTLDGLSPEQLMQRPGPESNPVGWLIWHMARMQDRGMSALTGEPQLWISGAWYERYGMAADPDDTGMGHDAAQVSAFTAPNAATLLEHYDAVLETTREYLDVLDPGDIDRVIETPPQATVGERLLVVVNGNMQHVGQAGYVRGLNEGRRWHPR
ncbi:MAG TPA: DinB family protein [Dehalococcoidia bacterium]|nr:DinB family protein [Dehalococcoidia bacterium]